MSINIRYLSTVTARNAKGAAIPSGAGMPRAVGRRIASARWPGKAGERLGVPTASLYHT